MRLRWLPSLVFVALYATSLPVVAHGHICLQADGTILDRGGHGKPGPTGATGDCRSSDLVEFVLGWQDEPPYAGLKNGLDLGLRTPVDKAPIANVTSLKAEYMFGNRTASVGTAPQFGRAGWYGEKIAPTRPGMYEVHIWGDVTVNGTVRPVNFTSRVAEVAPFSDIQFPDKDNGGPASTPSSPTRGAPGFEAFAVVGCLGLTAMALRRRW